jgi:hypothetical protein
VEEADLALPEGRILAGLVPYIPPRTFAGSLPHEPVLASSGAVSPVYEHTLVSWLKGSDPLRVVEG